MSKAERYLKLQTEMKDYIKPLGEASDIMINEDVTKYPIFVIHQQEVSIGVPIIDAEKVSGNWSVNASSLEEFATKKIILQDNVKSFIENFKDPSDHICIFTLSELGAQFIYLIRT